MCPPSCRENQLIGVASNRLGNLERPDPPRQQLRCALLEPEVLSGPDYVMRSPYSALRSRAIGSTPIGTPRVPLRSDRYTLPHLGSSRLGLRGMQLSHRRHYRQECNTSCPATFAGSSAAKSPIPLDQPPAPVSSDQPSSAIHTHAHHGLPRSTLGSSTSVTRNPSGNSSLWGLH